jgi:hypothetical protein
VLAAAAAAAAAVVDEEGEEFFSVLLAARAVTKSAQIGAIADMASIRGHFLQSSTSGAHCEAVLFRFLHAIAAQSSIKIFPLSFSLLLSTLLLCSSVPVVSAAVSASSFSARLFSKARRSHDWSCQNKCTWKSQIQKCGSKQL